MDFKMGKGRLLRTSRSKTENYWANITIAGRIGLGKVIVEVFELEQFEFARIFYDREKNHIGLHFTNDEKALGITKILKTKNQKHIGIDGRSFFSSINYRIRETRSYKFRKADEVELENFYSINLYKLAR